MNKPGQVSVFVIVAIVIVGIIVAYFAVRGTFNLGTTSTEFQPIFDRYQLCIEDASRHGIELAGLQGGRVQVEPYAPGSDYAPFSSHLNFLGTSIPYWYYLSGNGVFKENVPSKSEIERDIGDFVEEQVAGCDFSDFYDQGFSVTRGNPRATVSISDSSVRVQVNELLSTSRGEASASSNSQTVSVTSKFGQFYNDALRLYAREKNDAFLENYAVDALRAYAPVDGVELSCAPKIWKTQDVLTDLREALSSNIGQVKFKGSYYTLSEEENSYFVVDEKANAPVQLIYNPAWPSVIEVTPADQSLMIAKPVGNDPGLGAMGFCYIPYHFVYDVKFPVLFQMYDGSTLFQFPVSVVLDNNVPREVVGAAGLAPDPETDVCSFKTNSISITTFDTNLNPIAAEVSYQCFNSLCDVGQTNIVGEDAVLTADVPACVNGQLHVSAEGYAPKTVLFSSNRESSAEVILDREYPVQLDVQVDGSSFNGTAIVQFYNSVQSKSAAFPETSQLALSEGLYNVSVYIYGSSNIVIPASTRTECQKLPRPGLLGFFGGTKEQCFDITLPESKIDYALLGGGSASVYLLETELQNGRLTLSVPGVPTPSSLEEAQYAFEAVQEAQVEVIS